ncbi:MAG: efflux RND transporter permease subunit [Chloroherpetonaceae bacterium]|nr:efflux RND transporter permease subunit [Chloroherpetonaceae bacterium]MDW8437599.1 efflux RND transporter permease subunit [Chloroherpetonaceae bacterium]
MTPTQLFVKRPTLVVVLFAFLGALGLFGYSQLNYELLPKISAPVVVITTAYPGASPNEVETAVTKKIEEAVSSLDKVETISATSSEGVSFVAIQFSQSAKTDVVLQDAQRKVNEILAQLPEGAKTPVLSKIALDELPVMRVGVVSDLPPRELYQLVKRVVQPRLARLDGMAQVTLIGGEEREIRVYVNAEKLKSYGLSILQVSQAIKAANLDFPTGNVKDKDGQFVVRVAGKFNSLDELRDLVLARSLKGGDIRLRDVAEVVDGRKDFTNINRINGKTSIGLIINKQTDANAVKVCALVRDELAKIEKDYASVNLRFDIAQDASTFTLDAANAVKEDLALAVFLVALVMLVFLHSLRNSFIVMVAIPASLISTFGAMHLFGFSLNLMTLLALSLAVGIWVDDSIVVLENIYRRLELGEDRTTAAVRGREEIGFTALSITLVDVVVFVPLALTQGIVGNIMREFATTMAVSTLFSLLVSFTITPVLASRISKLERLGQGTLLGRFGAWFEERFERFRNRYVDVLRWSLRNRWKVGLSATLLFFGSCSLLPLGFIGGEFMPQADRGEFSVAIELRPGATLEETNLVSQRVEQMIRDIPEVQKVAANVGASSDGFVGQSASNIADIAVTLLPKEEREKRGMRSSEEIRLWIKEETKKIPGAKVRVNEIGIFGGANETPIQLVVSGSDYDSVMKGAELLMDVIKKTKGATDVRLSAETGKPETRIEIDRAKMAQFGLSVAEVGTALRIALAGDEIAKYRERGDEFDIRVQLDEFDRSKTENIGELTFVNARGQQVALKQFATIYQTTGPTKLQRRDRNPAVIVYAQTAGVPSGTIWQEAQAKLKDVRMPVGVTISPQGQLKNQADSFSSLGLALVAAILFVYLIMVALYDSYVHPLVVLFSMPLAVVGALLALALAAKSLSVFTILGIIMLMGLVSKNAILLIDFANKGREDGLTTLEALLEAGRERLRPILMTTLTMIFGMMPIALSSASGAEWKTGLAWALVGGLTSSMFLTLIVIPVVYSWFDDLGDKLPALFAKVVRLPKRKETFEPEPIAVEMGKTKEA